MLAAGKHLYDKVNVEQYISDYKKNNTWAIRFAERFSWHPNLPKRIDYIENNAR